MPPGSFVLRLCSTLTFVPYFSLDPAYFARWLKSYVIDKKWKYLLCNLEVTSYSDSKFHQSNYNYSPWLRKPASSIEDYAPLCLYYAALCGFYNLTRYLISEYPQHINPGLVITGVHWWRHCSTNTFMSQICYTEMAQPWKL